MLVNLSNIDDVKDYILIELRGSGLFDSEEGWFDVMLNETELVNIIDNTLRVFIENRYHGLVEGIYVLQATEDTRSYTIPSNIYAMPYMLFQDDASLNQIANEDIRSNLFYSGYNNLYGYGVYDHFRSYIYQLNTVIADSDRLFRAHGQYRFNWYTHTIELLMNPKPDEVFIFKTYYTDALSDGELSDYGEIFNDLLVRRHLIASAKLKLGWNLQYVSGIQVPNYSIDAASIYSQGKEELEKIEEEFKGNNDLTLISFGQRYDS